MSKCATQAQVNELFARVKKLEAQAQWWVADYQQRIEAAAARGNAALTIGTKVYHRFWGSGYITERPHGAPVEGRQGEFVYVLFPARGYYGVKGCYAHNLERL